MKLISQFSQKHSWRFLFCSLFVLSLLRLLWVGDIPFGNDDAQLFLQAINDSKNQVFTSHGLLGSRGMNYGPFAIWTYRLGLFFTRDLILFASARILITTFMVSLSVFLLARLTPALLPSLGFIALLSPYLWLYGRDLWDNSYVIPLSGLAITSYLYFCKKESCWALFLSLLLSTFGLLTHLVYLPILAGLGLHFVIYKRKWMKTHWPAFTLSLASCFFISLPYFRHLLSEKRSFTAGEVSRDLGHLFMPFLGPRFFTSLGIEHFTGKEWYRWFPDNSILNSGWIFLIVISALCYPIAWYGIYLAFKEVLNQIRNSQSKSSELFDISFICVSIFLIEIGLSFYLRLIPIPNFYSPFWIVFLFFLWLGFSHLWNHRTIKIIFFLVSISLSTGLIGLVWRTHQTGGNRWNHYGPTLENLVNIAHEIEELSPNTQLTSDTFHLSRFPLMMESLRQIIRPTIANPKTTAIEKVEIQYDEPNNLRSGKIILIKK